MWQLDTALRRALVPCLLWTGLLTACQSPPQTPKAGPTLARQSDKADRQAVAVTVYNQGFAVVKDTRGLRLADGRVELAFQDVSANIQPETVQLRSLTHGARLEVLEQNYRYDLLTPAKLLEKYVGRSITVYRYNEKTGAEEKKTAEVLSVEGGVTLRIDGEVTTNFAGRYAFPDVPQNLLDKPTLVWLVASDRAQQQVELTYLTRALSWRADYVLTLDETDTRAQLTGWVTLDNQSGTSYENAALRLVAGGVNRVPEGDRDLVATRSNASFEGKRQEFKQENLFEYHLYTLGRPTTLLDKETKQVSLLSADDVTVDKKLILNGASEYYRGGYGNRGSTQKVSVFVELKNTERNRLGMPLPKGTVRLYKADASGALQFLGEDAIDHTPRDEKLKLKVGEAFDVVAERAQKDWKEVGDCLAEADFEVELRNHKSSDVQVELNEPVGGDWEMLSHSAPYTKVDVTTLRFEVKVPARGSTKVTYRLRFRYC
jgi:hypothetical protein